MTKLVLTEEQNNLDLTTQEGKDFLGKTLLQQEQTEHTIIHRFGPGVYIREASYPANVMIVGQTHVGEHINMLLKGRINIFNDNGSVTTLEAPYMFVAKAGSKVGYTLEEVVWQNIYATNETNVEELEATLFKTPDYWKEHLQSKLNTKSIAYQIDRNDFQLMLKETNWKESDVTTLSNYTEDKIPFPYGNYTISQGNSAIQGKGLFATGPFYKDDVIAPMRINGKRTPAGYLVNHSKTPNCLAVLQNNDLYLVASKEIKGMYGGELGEEFTLDYRQVMLLNNLWNGEIKCQQV